MKTTLIFIVSLLALTFAGYLLVYRPIVVNDAFFLAESSHKDFKKIYPQESNLKEHVQFLTSVVPARHVDQIESLNVSALYIRAKLEDMGYTVSDQIYKIGSLAYKNLIVDIPANAENPSEELIVIGAHYDVCGDQPGADDNASGVAGLLELARMLKSADAPKRKYPVQLVAYTLEEPPTYGTENMGSFIHAKSLAEQNKKVVLMLSLEMIGFYSDAPNSQTFPISLLKLDYPTTGNFIALVSNLDNREMVRNVRSAMRAATDIDVFSINAPSSIPGIDFSDHRSYWKFGYQNAMMLTDTSFYRNPHYHKPSDTPDTLDYRKMGQVVAGVYGVVSLLE